MAGHERHPCGIYCSLLKSHIPREARCRIMREHLCNLEKWYMWQGAQALSRASKDLSPSNEQLY